MTIVIEARYNHGRWIADCPFCANAAEEVSPGDLFLCGNEFPGKHAVTWRDIEVSKNGKKVKQQVRVADRVIRQRAWDLGKEAGKIYKIKFHEEKKEVERITRMRPPENQNWVPGETLDDLRLENIEHGIIEHRR